MSGHDPSEGGRGYNLSDPQMPFCPGEQGARSLGSAAEDLERRLKGPDACELRELDLARGTARRLRAELIYGMPANAQLYDEQDVPTSLNLPMFMEFVYELLVGQKIPGSSSSSGASLESGPTHRYSETWSNDPRALRSRTRPSSKHGTPGS